MAARAHCTPRPACCGLALWLGGLAVAPRNRCRVWSLGLEVLHVRWSPLLGRNTATPYSFRQSWTGNHTAIIDWRLGWFCSPLRNLWGTCCDCHRVLYPHFPLLYYHTSLGLGRTCLAWHSVAINVFSCPFRS